MKNLASTTLAVLITLTAFSQTPSDIIVRVIKAQQYTKSLSYTLKRTDTLVTGDVRSMSGSVTMQPDKNDHTLGFLFSAKLDGDKTETVYDGHVGYLINNEKKTYLITSGESNVQHLLWGGGGWLVMPDLVKIDTSKAIALSLAQDAGNYYLKIAYADYKPEDVIKRYKTLTISKQTYLPMAMRSHQETMGRVQDLFYQIDQVKINGEAVTYDFSLPVLKGYEQEIDIKASPPPVLSLNGKAAPQFNLDDLMNSDKQINLSDQKGKVVLIDLWEVWCGPCIASMPKVQRLYNLYKDKGLQVLGIINDTKQAVPARQLVQKRNFTFPMLIGNEQFKKDYKLNGSVPMYLVIDKGGKVSFISQGYSPELEDVIKIALK